MTGRYKAIGAPLLYMDGKFFRNCVIEIDLTKKITNIAVNVEYMDSHHSVEYHSGVITPLWNGWKGTMTEPKKKELIEGYVKREGMELSGILKNACSGKNIETGYDGMLLLLYNIDFTNLKLKENSNLKIL